MEPSMSAELITRALSFHGQQLQKLWDSERGEADLTKNNVNVKEIDFSVYQQRQKQLSFQDRGKRLKLQQFIVKKAATLYEATLMEGGNDPQDKLPAEEDYYAAMPPYDVFISLDKPSRVKHFFQTLKKGDIIIASVLTKSVSGMMLKVLCTDGEGAKCVADVNVKAFCPTSNLIPASDKKSVNSSYLMNDTVRCEVLEVNPDTEKLVCGMKGVTLPPNSDYSSRLGLIHSDDFPEVYNMYKQYKANQSNEIQIMPLIAFMWPVYSVLLEKAKPRHIPVDTI
ncbi:hypothetical protein B7P43_G06205 [Cryptotermes secundus]|uniref:S1 motif domain-containing protein n=1 Tax=Cryptotermes secundus TaxID=105785 RepID=A0A2J7RAP0_9NEOP|nr:hypothetical protein B7P43_G06205 [Cryptotermes secundus]